jgi:hypothetical protein
MKNLTRMTVCGIFLFLIISAYVSLLGGSVKAIPMTPSGTTSPAHIATISPSSQSSAQSTTLFNVNAQSNATAPDTLSQKMLAVGIGAGLGALMGVMLLLGLWIREWQKKIGKW